MVRWPASWVFSDPIKKTPPGAIKALHDLGLKVIMATGDNRKTADAVARELAIDEVRAELNPKDKNEIIKTTTPGKSTLLRWQATGSTTHPPLLKPTWGSRWEPAQT